METMIRLLLFQELSILRYENLTLGEKEETYAHFAIEVQEPSEDEEIFQKAKK